MEGPPHETKVLTALDTAWSKLGIWAKAAMEELGLTEEETLVARELLSHDVILFLPHIRGFLNKHKAGLESRDLPYLEGLLPPSLSHLKPLSRVSEKTLDKAFLFARVFESLLDDLAQVQ